MSARGLVPGLASPHPVAEALPAIYAECDFTRRFTLAFDEILAPVFATLDNLDSYVDPALAPEDLLAWLGRWVGVALDGVDPIERRRELLARTVELYRWRGTARGIRELVRLWTGVEPELLESGATVWSATPGSAPPGSPQPLLVVRLRLPDDHDIEASRLDAAVSAAKPAHIPHRIELVG